MSAREFFTSYPPRLIRALLYLAFWFGIVWFILGNFVTFVPGAEQGFFTFTGAVLLSGLFIPRWPCRIASIVLVAVCILAAIKGIGAASNIASISSSADYLFHSHDFSAVASSAVAHPEV